MAKKRTTAKGPSEGPGKRRPGRPKRSQRAVTPEVLEEISLALLHGQSCLATAKRLEIDESTVRHYRDKVLRPQWEAEAQAQRGMQLAKIDRLEAFAWDRLYASTKPMRRKQIRQAVADVIKGKRGAGKADGTKGDRDLEIVERVMGSVTKIGEACWAQIIEWCGDYRARVFGYYAPTKHMLELNELRVAGPDPEAVDEGMLERLMQKVRERQEFLAAIRGLQSAPSRN